MLLRVLYRNKVRMCRESFIGKQNGNVIYVYGVCRQVDMPWPFCAEGEVPIIPSESSESGRISADASNIGG